MTFINKSFPCALSAANREQYFYSVDPEATTAIKRDNYQFGKTGVDRATFLAACLAIGTANGLIRPILVAVADQGWAGAFIAGLGTSYIIWCAIVLGFIHFARAEKTPLTQRDIIVGGSALACFLLPSAIASWAAMAALALTILVDRKCDEQMKRGAAILLAVGIREPLSFLALKLFASPLLRLDAILTAGLLKLWTGFGTHIGNIVEGADGHRLAILTGCASYTNLSIALLGWYALSRTFVVRWQRHHTLVGIAIGISVFVLNILRLVFMGMNPKMYAFFHDGFGVQIFEVSTLAVILILTLLSIKNEV